VRKEGQHPFEVRSLCMHTVLPVRSIREGQHQPWERTEARLWVRLLVRVMLGQLVVAAFVRTDLTGKISKHIYAPDLGPKFLAR